jgi:hypothetical protein
MITKEDVIQFIEKCNGNYNIKNNSSLEDVELWKYSYEKVLPGQLNSKLNTTIKKMVIPKSLLEDKDFAILLLNQRYEFFEYLPQSLKKDEDCLWLILKSLPRTLAFLKEKNIHCDISKSFAIKIVKEYGVPFLDLNSTLKDDLDVIVALQDSKLLEKKTYVLDNDLKYIKEKIDSIPFLKDEKKLKEILKDTPIVKNKKHKF